MFILWNPLLILLGVILVIAVLAVVWLASGRGGNRNWHEQDEDIALNGILRDIRHMEQRIDNIETILHMPESEPRESEEIQSNDLNSN